MNSEQLKEIGRQCKLVGAFAADMIGEYYPLSKTMCDTLFNEFDDEQLGQKFTEWFKKGVTIP